MTPAQYALVVWSVDLAFRASHGRLVAADKDDAASEAAARLCAAGDYSCVAVDRAIAVVIRRMASADKEYRRMVAAHLLDPYGYVTLVEAVPNPERDARIVAAVKDAGGDLGEAARLAGCSRRTVERHLHNDAPRKPRGGARANAGGARTGAGRPRKNQQSDNYDAGEPVR